MKSLFYQSKIYFVRPFFVVADTDSHIFSIGGCCELKLPTVVIACKSDLKKKIGPQKALLTIKKYDVGLVEVFTEKEGKDKMWRSFDWVLRAVFRPRRTCPHHAAIFLTHTTTLSEVDPNYRNPASPDILISPPLWENSGAATPTASSATSMYTPAQSQRALSPPTTPASAIPVRASPIPTSSPARARSTSDLKSEHEKLKNMAIERQSDGSRSTTELNAAFPVNGTDQPREQKQGDKERES
jgi:hypothetical protein